MKCAECRTELPNGARFCIECGRALQLDRSEFRNSDPSDRRFHLEPGQELEATPQDIVCATHGSRCLLDTVIRVGTCLTNTMDLDHFLEAVTTELVKSMELEAAGILLHHHRLNDFYWRELKDPDRILVGDTPDRPIRVNREALDQAFQTGEPFVVERPPNRSSARMACEARPDPLIRNALVVPLNTREKTSGLLVLANKKSGPFNERDIDVALSLAGVVAVSMENADFFDELLDSYRKVVSLERIKSKILHRLSHELKTPLAIIEGSLIRIEKGLKERGIRDFEAAFGRLFRQVQNLGRLEMQVGSIMHGGYVEQREMISGLLESAASLIEAQAEQTPETKDVASLILRTLEEAFPANQERSRRIDIKQFAGSVLEHARSQAADQNRRLTFAFDLENGSKVLIPDLVLHAIIEGLVRNAVEATPDNGLVSVLGRTNGDFYVLTVEDSGIGIPEEDRGLVFEGFYQVQETECYTSGRPYGFNAGGKGMDLFRIKMFSRIYGFGLYFRTRRCPQLIESLSECPGSVDRCPYCKSLQDCIDSGGTVFEVELPLAR